MYFNFYNVNYDVFKILRPDVGLIDIKTSSLDKYLNDSKILSNARYFHDAAGSPSFKLHENERCPQCLLHERNLVLPQRLTVPRSSLWLKSSMETIFHGDRKRENEKSKGRKERKM